ncbi:MAG TPA: DUF1232 domain-containing protein [Ignavibacteriaceae bacterium]|nr:DUF1232 domain-containing protein [Ignavibacteriaceae bacterium]
MANYSNKYNYDSFWDKIKNTAIKAGKDVIKYALILYYSLGDSETPKWSKSVIIAALGYFIFPYDAIPDFLPYGFTDDLGALIGAYNAIKPYIGKDPKRQAKKKLKKWF